MKISQSSQNLATVLNSTSVNSKFMLHYMDFQVAEGRISIMMTIQAMTNINLRHNNFASGWTC